MKFSGTSILFGLGLFISSCSAACNCSASDQPCMDKCVMAANNCIVKCEQQGDSCQQACIINSWPSMPIQKDVLADVTSAILTATASSGASMMSTSGSANAAAVSVYSTTLSGGSVSRVTSTIMKPSARPSSMPTPNQNINTPNSAVSSRQVVSAVTLISVMATVVNWML